MALWSTTKANIENRIETILRRLTGQETVTHQEKKAIQDSINQAIIDVCMDSGISRWRFIQADNTATTVASQQYVDLTAGIFNVVSGTVRIEAENKTLQEASLEFIYMTDPDRDDENEPDYYAVDSSSDPESIRLVFKPIPDGVYTIDFVGESIPDEDSISSFPSWMHGCLKDKATENALRDLGLLVQAMAYKASYEKRKQDAKASQGYDGPRHIRKSTMTVFRGLQSRVPD